MHSIIPGEGLRTQFSYAPSVKLTAHENDVMVVVMTFDSSTIDENGDNRVTHVEFTDVLDFRWSDYENGLKPVNPKDYAFALIQIEDSELIRDFSKGLTNHALTTDRMRHLQHYRISFDEHGTYDVVCTEIQISHSAIEN